MNGESREPKAARMRVVDGEPTEPTERALRKLRTFMLGLEPDERVALARLIAPGVERALAQDTRREWTPDAVQRWLKGADGRRRGD